jgi:hypothetical protein
MAEHAAQQQDPLSAKEALRPARPQAAVRADRSPTSVLPGSDPRRVLALQRMYGNAAVSHLCARHGPTVPTVQRGPLDWLADKLGTRPNEAEMDAYEDALDDLKDFKGVPHAAAGYEPSSGGKFDVAYTPVDGRLLITVKCSFTFEDDYKIEQDWTNPQVPVFNKVPVKWSVSEQESWKARFFQATGGTWSGQHVFWCQRDWWESLSAKTEVRFVEAPPNAALPADSAHFKITVRREGPESHVHPGYKKADLREHDVDDKPGTRGPTAAHEAGHMLGLGDDYARDGEDTKAWHSALVKAEFGHEVIRGQTDPESIMVAGRKVLPEHGVTFLEGLKAATKMPQWGHVAKPARAIPNSNLAPASAPSGPAPAIDQSSEGSAGGSGSRYSTSPPGYAPY